MVIRSAQHIVKGESPIWYHKWVSFDKISPHLPMAVIASEDNRFAIHNGFDFVEIKRAMKENEKDEEKEAQVPSVSKLLKTYFFGRNHRGYVRDLKSISLG